MHGFVHENWRDGLRHRRRGGMRADALSTPRPGQSAPRRWTDTAETGVVRLITQRRPNAGPGRCLSSNLHPSGVDVLMPKTLATATVDGPYTTLTSA